MSRVCLAISAYKTDAAIVRLLARAAPADPSEAAALPWSQVLVVDSQGSGAIARAIATRGLGERVLYQSFDTNLGSAGNLAERLSWAARLGFDYAYAINHDGSAEPDVVRALVAYAESRPAHTRGVFYPLRRYTEHGATYDVTGQFRLPLPYVGVREPPRTEAFDVYWGSSNGALYALTPIARGLTPWADFFMGWEDLAYGWLLHERGYEQRVLTSAVVSDNYEYRRAGVGRASVRLSDKPVWYAYYVARNLILATRRTRSDVRTAAMVGARIAAECAVTTALRADKRERLRLIAAGVADGLRGVAGRGPVP